MFLHHVLHQDENSLIYRFFTVQISHLTKGDWASEILQDMEELNIDISLSDIGAMTKQKFQYIVKEKVNYHAFQYLLDMKDSRNSIHSKGKKLQYTELSMAEYLAPADLDISIDEKK